jgi:uncharacterized membrane protein YccC
VARDGLGRAGDRGPLAAGLAAGQLVPGVLAAVGGLVGMLADRPGPYPVLMRRILTAGVFGGAAGLLLGLAINSRAWVAVVVLIAVAGVSAMISSVSATWSLAGLYLLVYAALATGSRRPATWTNPGSRQVRHGNEEETEMTVRRRTPPATLSGTAATAAGAP